MIGLSVLQCEDVVSGTVDMACSQELGMAVIKKDILSATAAQKTMIAAVKFPRSPVKLQPEWF